MRAVETMIEFFSLNENDLVRQARAELAGMDAEIQRLRRVNGELRAQRDEARAAVELFRSAAENFVSEIDRHVLLRANSVYWRFRDVLEKTAPAPAAEEDRG